MAFSSSNTHCCKKWWWWLLYNSPSKGFFVYLLPGLLSVWITELMHRNRHFLHTRSLTRTTHHIFKYCHSILTLALLSVNNYFNILETPNTRYCTRYLYGKHARIDYSSTSVLLIYLRMFACIHVRIVCNCNHLRLSMWLNKETWWWGWWWDE